MLRRFGIYLIGVSIGIVFVLIIFKGKRTEFCYFPNCRVIKDIIAKPMNLTNLENFEQKDSTFIKELIKNSKVDFSKSNTKLTNCKTYFLTKEAFTILLKNCDSIVKIESINER